MGLSLAGKVCVPVSLWLLVYARWSIYEARIWWLELSSSSTVNVVVGGKQCPAAFKNSHFAQGYLGHSSNSQLFHLVGISISAELHEVRWFWRLQIPSCDQ